MEGKIDIFWLLYFLNNTFPHIFLLLGHIYIFNCGHFPLCPFKSGIERLCTRISPLLLKYVQFAYIPSTISPCLLVWLDFVNYFGYVDSVADYL